MTRGAQFFWSFRSSGAASGEKRHPILSQLKMSNYLAGQGTPTYFCSAAE